MALGRPILVRVGPDVGRTRPIPADVDLIPRVGGHAWPPTCFQIMAQLGRCRPTLIYFDQLVADSDRTWADVDQTWADYNQSLPRGPSLGCTRPKLVRGFPELVQNWVHFGQPWPTSTGFGPFPAMLGQIWAPFGRILRMISGTGGSKRTH